MTTMRMNRENVSRKNIIIRKSSHVHWFIPLVYSLSYYMHGATQKKVDWIGLLFQVQKKANNTKLQERETSNEDEAKRELELIIKKIEIQSHI